MLKARKADLRRRALNEGLELVHEDGRRFNAGGAAQAPSRSVPMPAPISAERAVALHGQTNETLLTIAQVIDNGNQTEQASQSKLLSEIKQLRKRIESPPAWRFEVERSDLGFIKAIIAKAD